MSSPNQNPTIWDDKLTIETPEQTSLEFPLAGVGSRCMAMVLDTLIQTGVIIVLVIAMLVLQSQLGDSATGLGLGGLWIQAIAYLILFALYYGYFAFFEAIWNGQTPGKRVAHLRVIQESGRPLQVWQAIARNLLRIVDQLPGFYAVGMTSALKLKRLKDDKNLWPPYYVAPVVRKEALDANPKIAEIANRISAMLDEATISAMNYKVDGEKMEPRDVAADFLKSKGVIK